MKERLTKRLENGGVKIENETQWSVVYPQNYKGYDIEAKALLRLAEYEDLEEQGLIVRLPTTLNKPAYIIMGDKSIKEMTVLEYYVEPNGIFVRLAWKDGRHNMRMTVPVKELNNCYAEAKKKLKESEFENRVKLGQCTIIDDD